jgi:hypothetical protein
VVFLSHHLLKWLGQDAIHVVGHLAQLALNQFRRWSELEKTHSMKQDETLLFFYHELRVRTNEDFGKALIWVCEKGVRRNGMYTDCE